ncbi:hypothetical protein C8J57DRAFT_214908 [Mycena rebaudengoi]|nr:hypothetical protein C8J57DRAFT_214908 [Mycena rebaudengoi]
MLLPLCAFLALQTILPALAGPLAAFHPHADGTLNSEKDIKFSATTWITIMVVCVVLMILSIPVCLLESLRRHIASMNASAAIAASSRELQLVGSIGRSLGAPPHRPRRPCHTPSQVSPASLPAYMKEPGDQELVVSRGPDGEDVAASVDDNTHADNINITPPARAYSHIPRLPTQSSLLVSYSTTPDPRGDPPAYFEVIEHDDNILHHSISIKDYPPGIPQRGFCASIFSPPPPPPVPSNSTLALSHTPPPRSPPRPRVRGVGDRGPADTRPRTDPRPAVTRSVAPREGTRCSASSQRPSKMMTTATARVRAGA